MGEEGFNYNNIASNLKIVGVNARSINGGINKYALHNLFLNNKFDILIILESWVLRPESYKISNKNYNFIANKATNMGNGCIIFFRTHLNIIKTFMEFNNENFTVTRLKINNSYLFIIGAHLAPHNVKQNKLEFLLYIVNFLKNRYTSPNILIFSDLNFNLFNELNIREKITKLNLIIHEDITPNKYTRFELVQGEVINNYLDYFFSFNINISNFKILGFFGNSDHFPLSLTCSFTENLQLNYTKKMNLGFFKKNYDDLYHIFTNPASYNWQSLDNIIISRNNKIKIKNVKQKNYFKPIKKINILIQEMHHTKDIDLKNIIKAKTTNLIYKLNSEDFSLFLMEILNFRLDNESKKYYTKLSLLRLINGEFFVNRLYINLPNNEFDILSNYDKVLDKLQEKYLPLFSNNKINKTNYLLPNDTLIEITKVDVLLGLRSISKNKALSWDLIPDSLFSFDDINFPLILEFVFKILIEIISSKKFPLHTNIGRLFILNKDPSNIPILSNLRPINITSPLLKTLESIILTKLKEEILTKEILNKSQTGFMEGGSTIINIFRLFGLIKDTKTNNKKQPKTYVLFIDLKAAFDSVDHEILFTKLNNNHIPTEIINTIKFIYSNSYTKLSPNNIKIPINRGVLQGSLLSPLLFNIYINDLINEIEQIADIFAFADDIAIVCYHKYTLKKLIKIIRKWGDINRISLNESKSGIFLVSKNKFDFDSLDSIPVVKTYKYLGILLDNKFSPIPHLEIINKRYNEFIEFIRKLSIKIIPFKIKIEIWKTYFRSILSYGTEIFLFKDTWFNKLNIYYTKSFKISLNLIMNTNLNQILLYFDEWDFEIFLILNLTLRYKSYLNYFDNKFEIPSTLQNLLEELLLKFKLDLSIVNEKKQDIKNRFKIINREILFIRVFPDSPLINFNLKLIGKFHKKIDLQNEKISQKVDNIFIKFLANRSIVVFEEGKYAKCITCNDKLLSQIHIIEECPFFNKEHTDLTNFMSKMLPKTKVLIENKQISIIQFLKNFKYLNEFQNKFIPQKLTLITFFKSWIYSIHTKLKLKYSGY